MLMIESSAVCCVQCYCFDFRFCFGFPPSLMRICTHLCVVYQTLHPAQHICRSCTHAQLRPHIRRRTLSLPALVGELVQCC